MKKLILSAVFAVACFTAQAKNEVVSNDDKNPKGKTKVVVKTEKQAKAPCTMYGSVVLDCPDGPTCVGYMYTSQGGNCFAAYIIVAYTLDHATC